MRERSEELDKRFKETDRKFQESERLMRERSKELDRRFKQTDKKIGQLGNRLGDFVEEMVKPGAVKLFRDWGMDIHAIIGDLNASDDEGGIQVDLLLENASDVVAIECKSALSVDDVNDHLERLAKFRKYFPRYADARVMGAVAAMVIPQDVSRYAYKKGLFVLAQHGEFMVILNKEPFSPQVW